MTYLEPLNLFSDIMTPYIPGGKGSKQAIFFVAVMLNLDDPHATKSKAFVASVLEELKRLLEEKDSKTKMRPLEQRLLEVAKSNDHLAPFAEQIAKIGGGCFTGGTLETMLWYTRRALKSLWLAVR